jgi:hypothetical protein
MRDAPTADLTPASRVRFAGGTVLRLLHLRPALQPPRVVPIRKPVALG